MAHFDWPKTLQKWRDRCWKPEGGWPYDLWRREPLQKFFREHGYTLWTNLNLRSGLGDTHLDHVELYPPNDEPRRPDGYTFVSNYESASDISITKPNFCHLNNIHCPARTVHNQDVLIRLVSIDGDVNGDEHYEAIRRLSAGQSPFRGDNYALPLLNELEFNGLRFVVFTMGGYISWFYTGVKFCHDNLIAHLDLDSDNTLFNYLGGRMVPDNTPTVGVTGPFRSHFPIRYYINGFETAVCFDKDSDLASRKITGPPDVRVGRTEGEYARECAPEMLTGEPYCPFKADVWYLGRMLHIHMDTEVKGFVEKYLKVFHEDFSFDDVFSKFFAQDAIQNESIMQVFEEHLGTINEANVVFPGATL
ncbi:hypothetical protein EV421DRAFT_2035874 [Armillaria borealis]|uniref:Uncharacterized protein n=1 Tax=Armillaria borealis TaxID=47425 RepID=A0AA39MQK2_9AGAR|nr:hypothetical protein EV421DRAFT_2035874 [Armillaria borealis]